MDPDTRAVHIRLTVWGEWAKQCAENGWPPITLLGRMIKQGPNGASQTGKPPISMPDEIAETDAAVAKLCEIDKRAIVGYYTKWEPIEALARRLHMRTQQIHNVLRRARWRLNFALDVSGGIR